MNYNEALDKVRKLLRLSESANPHEAALAASRAQEIMERFKIERLTVDTADREPSEAIRDFGIDPLEGNFSTWQWRFLSALTQLNQCKAYTSNRRFCLVGRASDVNTVRYIFTWLTREIERLASRDCQGCGRTYWNNYRIGAAETVANRLREQSKQTVTAVKHEAEAVSSLALVKVEKALAERAQELAEVEKWAKDKLHLRSRGGSRSNWNQSAREAGRAAGREVSLRPSAGRIAPNFGGLIN